MANKRKRHRRTSSVTRSSSPMKRKSSSRKRHKKSFHLSEVNVPFLGKMAFEPVGKGAAGAGLQVLANKVVPDVSLWGIPLRPLMPFLLSLIAIKMKQPLVAAGLAGAGTIMLAQKVPMLSDGFQSTRYADPNLLREGVTFYDDSTGEYHTLSPDECRTLNDQLLLSDGNLLSSGVQNPYGSGTFLGEENEE